MALINQSTAAHSINVPVITGVFIALLRNNKALIKIPSQPELLIIPDIGAIEKELTKIWLKDIGRKVKISADYRMVLSITPESKRERDLILQKIAPQPKKKYCIQTINTIQSRRAIPKLETIYEDKPFFDHSANNSPLFHNDNFSNSGYFEEEEYLIDNMMFEHSKQADNHVNEDAYSFDEYDEYDEYNDLCQSLLANILRTVVPLKDNLARDYPGFYKQFVQITNEVDSNYQSQVYQLHGLAQKFEDGAAPVCCFFRLFKGQKNNNSTQFIAKIRRLDLVNLNMETIERVFPTVESENGMSLDS